MTGGLQTSDILPIWYHANGAANVANFAYASVNSNWTIQNLVYSTINANYTMANAGYITLNAAYETINAVYASSNSNWQVQNLVYTTVNVAYTLANAAYENANSLAVAANAWSNHVSLSANSYAGYMANSANIYAESMYVRLVSPSQTITGDIGITGNLTISGNVTFANTRELQVGDNIITLNADLPVDVMPLENAGIEINRGSKNSNAALLWIENVGKWAITGNGAQTISTFIATNTDVGVLSDTVNNVYASANSNWVVQNALFTLSNTIYSSSNSNWVVQNLVYSTTNAAYMVANAAYANANAVAIYANNWANTIGVAGNNWTNTVAISANSWANTKLSNTSGIVFDGHLTFTGNVTAANVIVTGQTTFISANSVTIGQSEINSVSYITTTTNDQTIDSFLNTSYRFANYLISMNAGSEYETTQISVLHNDADAFMTEFGTIWTNNILGIFSVSYASGTIMLNVIPTYASTTIRLLRTTNTK